MQKSHIMNSLSPNVILLNTIILPEFIPVKKSENPVTINTWLWDNGINILWDNGDMILID